MSLVSTISMTVFWWRTRAVQYPFGDRHVLLGAKFDGAVFQIDQ